MSKDLKKLILISLVFLISGLVTSLEMYSGWRNRGWVAPTSFALGLIITSLLRGVKLDIWKSAYILLMSWVSYFIATFAASRVPGAHLNDFNNERVGILVLMGISGLIGSIAMCLFMLTMTHSRHWPLFVIGGFSGLTFLGESGSLLAYALLFVPWHVGTGLTIALAYRSNNE